MVKSLSLFSVLLFCCTGSLFAPSGSHYTDLESGNDPIVISNEKDKGETSLHTYLATASMVTFVVVLAIVYNYADIENLSRNSFSVPLSTSSRYGEVASKSIFGEDTTGNLFRYFLIPVFVSPSIAVLGLLITCYNFYKANIDKDLLLEQRQASDRLPDKQFSRARLHMLRQTIGGGPGLGIMISNRTETPLKYSLKLIDVCIVSETDGPVPRFLAEEIAEWKDDVCFFKVKEKKFLFSKRLGKLFRTREPFYFCMLYGLGSKVEGDTAKTSNEIAVSKGCFLIMLSYLPDGQIKWIVKEPYRDNRGTPFWNQTPRITDQDMEMLKYAVFPPISTHTVSSEGMTSPDAADYCQTLSGIYGGRRRFGNSANQLRHRACKFAAGICENGKTLYFRKETVGNFTFSVEVENNESRSKNHHEEDTFMFILHSVEGDPLPLVNPNPPANPPRMIENANLPAPARAQRIAAPVTVDNPQSVDSNETRIAGVSEHAQAEGVNPFISYAPILEWPPRG